MSHVHEASADVANRVKRLIAALEAANVLTERELDETIETFLTHARPATPVPAGDAFPCAPLRCVTASRSLPIGSPHGELEGGAVRRTRRRPDPSAVSLDDGTADRESHTHAGRLGREEGFENML